MAKKVFLVLLAVIAVIVVVQVFLWVEEKAKPLAPSPADLQELKSTQLTNESEIIVTMDNNRYHRPDCTKIYGVTETITLEEARSRGVHSCPICIATGSD